MDLGDRIGMGSGFEMELPASAWPREESGSEISCPVTSPFAGPAPV